MSVEIARRGAIAIALGAGLVSAWPAIAAEASQPTPSIDTRSGKVRGLRANGVSVFRGIPCGGDTAKRRFQPAVAPESWTGVRDCFVFGPKAHQVSQPQLAGTRDSEAGRVIEANARSGQSSEPMSEACLVLNVYTPDASPRRKRPVMFWLHGGSFTTGTSGLPGYDGSNLCRRDDVVVVTINHRLNALGYLYLGDLHSDFADSGNAAQLDIVLALQWVRDNIAAFGGDPGNLTVFGQSGGSGKLTALLATPPAKGLFHKGIIQSTGGTRMVERAAAAARAEKLLASLGIAKADVHKLQTMDTLALLNALGSVPGPLGPVVDGRTLLSHPFDPAATEVSRDIPIIIGTTKDEQTTFMALQPKFGTMTEEDVRKSFDTGLREKGAATFELYKRSRPNDPPTYWMSSAQTDSSRWMASIRIAERKAAQQAAPAFMYRFEWESPAASGALRASHGLDVRFVFDNVDRPDVMVGSGPEQRRLAAQMSQAWVNFARTGDPSQKGLGWPRYDAAARKTMIFEASSRVVSDPDREKRLFWAQT